MLQLDCNYSYGVPLLLNNNIIKTQTLFSKNTIDSDTASLQCHSIDCTLYALGLTLRPNYPQCFFLVRVHLLPHPSKYWVYLCLTFFFFQIISFFLQKKKKRLFSYQKIWYFFHSFEYQYSLFLVLRPCFSANLSDQIFASFNKLSNLINHNNLRSPRIMRLCSNLSVNRAHNRNAFLERFLFRVFP